MAPGLQRFTDIAGDGGPRLDAASGEELLRVDHAASVAFGRRAPEPPGTLFVTTRRVIWLSETEKGQGNAVDFLAITLHAVSRDPEAYPSPCIYTQFCLFFPLIPLGWVYSALEHYTDLEMFRSSSMGIFSWVLVVVGSIISAENILIWYQILVYCFLHTPIFRIPCSLKGHGPLFIDTEDCSEEAGGSDSEANGELQLTKVSEMRIILSDPGQLDALFDVFCHCAELNPDPNAGGNEENGWFSGENMAGGGWIHGDEDMTDGNGLEADMFFMNLIGQNGVHDLGRSVRELQIDDQRFEDAEEEHETRENGH
uniref:Chloride conductance regulatory protein ICln n=1 Tax=Leersia perrieri TaxID=77586 RepID=A0A0D9VRW8_9ORYZ